MDGEHEIQKAYQSILGHDFEKAIEWFEKAILLEPDNAAYHHKLSITYARSNKLQKAVQQALQAVRLDSNNELYLLHLHNLQAREKMQQAELQLDPTNLKADQAIESLKEAIALDPLSKEAYLILSAAYASKQNYRHALYAVQEALRLDPLDDIAKRQAAEYSLKLNKRK
ncbi:tetratricopeptide repeat protein [Paenibacillus eucommiae]|uniref:Tetratricopeptide (TPR) repeat protein n=1 Tax=Paenibacillus eucommiae TaxID=1355755 RepID=A0ABS4J4J1_9BACL|nr:tetratricopeptide repeat protein [Paenibacillus eucommiae]MBP1994759.1 tetratricopeptide (TPR) repeat protein [Paenibacillus eucommiae]